MNQAQQKADQQERSLSGEERAKPQNILPPDLFKAEVLATFSHELGSPLTAIKGYASTLLRLGQQMDSEERQAFLQAIQDAGDRMHIIIDHLLKVSQLEAGLRPVHLEDINLVSLVQEALAIVEQSLKRQQGHQEALFPFHFVMDNQLAKDEAVIQADGALLHEVLDNLLGNAIRFSPEGGHVTVTLSQFHPKEPLASVPAHLPLVAISVSDQGIGIAPEHLSLIFERFYRVDTRLTRETGGLGLGLALCQRVAELHQGTIQVESALGKGSIFHLVLPCLHPANDGVS